MKRPNLVSPYSRKESSEPIGAGDNRLRRAVTAAMRDSAFGTSLRSSSNEVVPEPLYRPNREACKNQYSAGSKGSFGKRSRRAPRVTSAAFVGRGSSLKIPYDSKRCVIASQVGLQRSHAGRISSDCQKPFGIS